MKYPADQVQNLFEQVNQSYIRCQNKILFDSYLRKKDD